jgi:hypothetical protein
VVAPQVVSAVTVTQSGSTSTAKKEEIPKQVTLDLSDLKSFVNRYAHVALQEEDDQTLC